MSDADKIDRTWNPTKPWPNHETFSMWMRCRRELGGDLSKQAPSSIVLVVEANMAGQYWRLLWPKDDSNPSGEWWQAEESRKPAPGTLQRERHMPPLTDEQVITLGGKEYTVHATENAYVFRLTAVVKNE